MHESSRTRGGNQHAAAELKGDREIVLAAVAQRAWVLEYAAAELKARVLGSSGDSQ